MELDDRRVEDDAGGSLIDGYRRVLAEEGAEEVRRKLRGIEERLWHGAPERGEEPLFGKELEVVRRRGGEARRGEAGPDLLLLTVGYSPEPLLLAVAHHAPREVVFLAMEGMTETSQSGLAGLWNRNRRALRQPPYAEIWDARWRVRDSAADFFRVVRRVVGERRREGSPRILLDITGAKKSQVSGAFLAAGFLDVDVGYVDFDEYDVVLHRPVPGASRPGVLSHPLRLFRLREEERLAAAFDGRRYEEARELAESLRQTAGSPEVVEVLGDREARASENRYAAIARVAEAYEFWAGGFFHDARAALEASRMPVPPGVALLAEVWPSRGAGHDEIVKALAEENVYSRPEVALAYFMDVLVWVDEDLAARRPRDAYLRLYGTIESVLSYVFEALVGRKPERLKVTCIEPEKAEEPEQLERLAREIPAGAEGQALDWEAELHRAAVRTLRQSGGVALAVLAGKSRSIRPEIERGRLCEADQARARLLIPWRECRMEAPGVDAKVHRHLNLWKYSELRHKAVHWLAPVPPDMARDLRLFYRELLRLIIPICVEEWAEATSPAARRDLEGWRDGLLAAAQGELPTECSPLRFAELSLSAADRPVAAAAVARGTSAEDRP